MMKYLFILPLILLSLKSEAQTYCYGGVQELRTGKYTSAVLAMDPSVGALRATIDGFVFGAQMETHGNVTPGGGVSHKGLGYSSFSQASALTDGTGTLAHFFHSIEIAGKWVTLTCEPTLAE